jgi:hypothetical protein
MKKKKRINKTDGKNIFILLLDLLKIKTFSAGIIKKYFQLLSVLVLNLCTIYNTLCGLITKKGRKEEIYKNILPKIYLKSIINFHHKPPIENALLLNKKSLQEGNN